MSGEEIGFGNVQKNVIGASVRGDRNIFGENVKVVNNTIQLQLDDAGRERLEKLLSIKTEISPQYGKSSAKASTDNMPLLKEDLEKLIDMVSNLQKKDEEVDELRSGKLKFSQGDMLLKKAVLIKTEAEQLLLDQLQNNKEKGFETQFDLSAMLSVVDEKTYISKMEEVLQLLEKALNLEPANVEILLQMAQVIGQLEPDQPAKERKLLAKVLNLLKHPKNELEWFFKAEATFLLATAGDETHPDLLLDAREIFERINRREWVRQCDDLLKSFGEKINDKFVHPPSVNEPVQIPKIKFHPVGSWHVVVDDGSVINVHFFPNGVVQGTQQNAMTWQSFSFNGQWAYIPDSRILQMQGSTSFGYPFNQVITIQQKQDEQYLGYDMNGYHYQFTSL